MLYAEWEGKTVRVYNENKQMLRTIRARFEVAGVQCSGTDLDDGRVAIFMANGKTDLYHANGVAIRLG